jgi:hypothetical protein
MTTDPTAETASTPVTETVTAPACMSNAEVENADVENADVEKELTAFRARGRQTRRHRRR